MAHSYTPGLRFAARTTLRKHRRLPLSGQVLVQAGEAVRAEQTVARAELPGPVTPVNVTALLGVPAGDIHERMLRKEGDAVQKGDIIAETLPFFRFLRSEARSPVDGVIETVSKVTGQVMIRAAPRPVNLRAYVDGTAVEVTPGKGVVVETTGMLVQGILGVGGEVCGALAVVSRGPEEVVAPEKLDESLRGKIVVAGAFLGSALFRRAAELGIEALIGGGFDDQDLRDLLGHDLGVAVTGHEPIKPVLIVTEGFGRIPMARGTYDLLASRAGQRASASGATQIRAGVLRPEIIVPELTAAPAPAAEHAGPAPEPRGLEVGARVRIIREPCFGVLGKIASLPAEPEAMPSEVVVRVACVRLDDGSEIAVPRSNVELFDYEPTAGAPAGGRT